MYILILVLPLLSFIICISFGRKIGGRGSRHLSCSLILISFVLALIIFGSIVVDNNIQYINVIDWFSGGLLFSTFSLKYDTISSVMLILVLSVSFLVHVFSINYMKSDPHIPRFMSYLSLFTFFMVELVTAGNLVQLFIGWEGVGLCSYLLINFWYTRIEANKAAIKAMLINKVGDLGLLLGIILLWLSHGSWNYLTLFSCSTIINVNCLFEGSLILLLVAVIGKSAQFGLHMWLPDAMEGPTPVSALIHAATMVTAGVFLIIRLSPLFDKTPFILVMIVLIGSITAFFSSTIGLAQNDFKKVIAYSTCSQLGYMVLICGFSYYELSLYHLVNHGFFKALLFLSAGSVIHALRDEQDIRKGGNLINTNPITFVCMLIGSLSLMGLPFLTGFYSKDLIIEIAFGSRVLAFGFWLSTFSAFVTAFYSFRLLFFSFILDFQGFKESVKYLREEDWYLVGPLLILSVMSILAGFGFYNFILKDQFPVILPNFAKWITLLNTIGGSVGVILFSSIITFHWKIIKLKLFHQIYTFIYFSWYVDKILAYYVVNSILILGFNITYKFTDNQVLENLGPYWFSNYLKYKAGLSTYYRGFIHSYLFLFVISIICFVIQL